MDDHGRVDDARAVHERGPDDQHGQQVGRGLDELGDSGVDARQQGVLHQQVVDGVPAQRQLGEQRDRDALVVARARLRRARCAALAAGSAIATGTVQAATRAKPWAYAE